MHGVHLCASHSVPGPIHLEQLQDGELGAAPRAAAGWVLSTDTLWAGLPVNTTAGAFQVRVFCFPPVSPEAKAVSRALLQEFWCVRVSAWGPIRVSAWPGVEQGWIFLFPTAAVAQVVSTKAVSGPGLGRFLCPSATS